ncbi:MAG: adenylosuccinate lyase [Rhodobacteraceae bacterium]|nr:adenylosuccinate lyase [Paracoccaceae bacterium]MBR9820449.1 adenylosuccinate lyase [Paracoccaceae bacterium]
MGLFSKLDKHMDLMSGMAERIGVDLDEALQGEVSANGYRAAVLRCASCREAGACAQWQEAHATAHVTPGYCRNTQWFGAFPHRK